MSKEDWNEPIEHSQPTEYEDIASYSTESKTARAKRPKWVKNIVIITFSIMLLVVGAGFIYAHSMLNLIHYVPDDSSSDFAAYSAPEESQDADSDTASLPSVAMAGDIYSDPMVQNILLMGKDDGRSDSMILVSIDKRHKKLKMTSIMRDCYVHIPGHQDDRINVAYADGGPKLTMQTIERNFGVAVDRYALVDYDTFPQIIERLGGVQIELSQGEASLVNQYSEEPNAKKRVKAGTNNLTGKQALYYARIRDIGNDYERTLRQRKVLSSLISKVKANPTMIDGVLRKILPEITTNIQPSEMQDLFWNALTYLNYPTSQYRVPADGTFDDQQEIRDMKVIVLDMEKNRKLWWDFLFEDALSSAVKK